MKVKFTFEGVIPVIAVQEVDIENPHNIDIDEYAEEFVIPTLKWKILYDQLNIDYSEIGSKPISEVTSSDIEMIQLIDVEEED